MRQDERHDCCLETFSLAGEAPTRIRPWPKFFRPHTLVIGRLPHALAVCQDNGRNRCGEHVNRRLEPDAPAFRSTHVRWCFLQDCHTISVAIRKSEKALIYFCRDCESMISRNACLVCSLRPSLDLSVPSASARRNFICVFCSNRSPPMIPSEHFWRRGLKGQSSFVGSAPL
jgi:hypothetical protein